MLIRGVQDLETHVQAREGTPVWVYNEKSVVPFLTSLKDNNGNPLFSKEYIHEATGALDTNSFQVQDADVKARAVFPTASLFNNSCKPNCFRVVNRNGISIITTELVKKGSELTICYTGLLTPTHIRQAVFKHTKHFNCSCPRCLDVTEEGTFPTCLLCSACGGRLEGNSCISCNQSQDAQRIEQISLLCDTLVSRLVQEENCEILTGGLMKLRRLVYLHHYLLVKLKLHFIKHSEKCSTCYDGAARAQCSTEIADLLKIHKIEKTWLKHEEIRGNQETLCSWKSLMAEKKEN
ncbi:uncharacterized protein LOC111714033 [Eurytemora carolleeae]|uniref:uncharacterized protein LOC111714033 n=1 Tax=Eurytemora carolleeae TaxID=1294199 RepID=UPI000C788702|nr:uncharacterized protein LOC111714033 [Eurytemora carolleeae]|eukprot:XP_023344803.1 uncharacterized protein LOC111714033 [Eurytemora affinis]